MIKCPFSSNDWGGQNDCITKDCKMWHNDDCLIKTYLVQATTISCIIPDPDADEKVKAEIERLKKQSEMLNMGFSILETVNGLKERPYGY